MNKKTVTVYAVEGKPGDPYFIVGERVVKKWYKHSFKKKIEISREFAKQIIKTKKINRFIDEFSRDILFNEFLESRKNKK
jgi:hypothetical protein